MREGWQESRVGDVCKVVAGQSPKGSAYNNHGDGLPFHQGKKYFRESLLGDSNTWTTQVTKEAFPGDILMSVRAPVGPINFTDQHMCIGRGLAAIRATDKVDRMFLFYWLSFIQSEIQGNEGAVFASINKQQIETIALPLPPLPEQKRIVAILDEAFAGIATAVANTEKNLANARELFESYLNAAIDAAFSSGEIAVLADLATEITDGDHMPPPKAPSGIPFVTIKNIDKRTRKIDFEDTFSVPRDYFERLKANKRPQEGDVLYTVTGSFGIPVLVENKTEFCFQRHIGLIRPKADTNSRWLYYLLLSPQLFAQAIERATGTAQKTVSLKVLRSFRVPVVQWNQQLDVVKSLDEISAEAERLESIYQQKLTALAELKQSILQKAFSGELTTAPRDEIENALA